MTWKNSWKNYKHHSMSNLNQTIGKNSSHHRIPASDQNQLAKLKWRRVYMSKGKKKLIYIMNKVSFAACKHIFIFLIQNLAWRQLRNLEVFTDKPLYLHVILWCLVTRFCNTKDYNIDLLIIYLPWRKKKSNSNFRFEGEYSSVSLKYLLVYS